MIIIWKLDHVCKSWNFEPLFEALTTIVIQIKDEKYSPQEHLTIQVLSHVWRTMAKAKSGQIVHSPKVWVVQEGIHVACLRLKPRQTSRDGHLPASLKQCLQNFSGDDNSFERSIYIREISKSSLIMLDALKNYVLMKRSRLIVSL